jgi:predicted esterase
VLVLHGGSPDSFASTRWRDLAVLRLWPVARAIARDVPDATVYRLRFSTRGWNGSGDGALRDARWALDIIRNREPGIPIVLVGHSLGGRVALRVGGEQGIAGVVGLTPWIPSNDPAAQLAGVPVVVIQAGRDRVIPEQTTRPWLARAEHAGARLTRTVLPWAGHTMLRRFWVWHRLAAQGVHTVLTESAELSRPSRTPLTPSP